MSWYNEAIFYHIYPLGLTGAPKTNDYSASVSRLNTLLPWIDHIKEIGCTALYIGPLFESVGHGYETTDYKKLDSRLGTNEDLKNFVAVCHEKGIKVIFDGVFNHTGRDFFAFKDIQQNREHSRYLNWYCNVNFGGNNEYNDGFSYENWGGYNLLVKLNQRNPEVQNYICDVIRFWVSEFDVDGIRLDAADVLDFDFMRALRRTAAEVKEDFWLMGEVIHGDYSRWVNGETLHSVTNYALHKALYSGHNDHNYFEIAHTVKYLQNMGNLDLYNFVDNHDVERIYTKLSNKAHFAPVHVLLYTLPGVPSIYYGSEFGIEGKKEKFSDDSLRPALNLKDYADAITTNPNTALIAALGKVRQHTPALSYGSYTELHLTNRQFAFARDLDGVRVIVTVNNDDNAAGMSLPAGNCAEYVGTLTGQKVSVEGGRINVTVAANSGEIWVPADTMTEDTQIKVENAAEVQATSDTETSASAETSETKKAEIKEAVTKETAQDLAAQETAAAKEESACANETCAKDADKTDETSDTAAKTVADLSKAPEDMTVAELQLCILAKMATNGPVTDQMKKTVYDNIWHDSLVNWFKSFR
ncbi:alpha-amylase [Ruminococcus sp. AF24-32LB]|jgi:cyclomaltodextrinase / maltogenic alpha-amylase / neopullulanase|nr:alpha-amylase family glycosyl hydrolase [uncultured Blautia sp.]RGW23277.1 alpha-amylase [Ruminococcus sp. AF13-37]RGW24765.1 alpha-amylase [Ruminococcus sp. AF13-28]RHG58529.1 alpha-amylase [Ruminococcus sp. AM22-13]RHQ67887.1 alpha-amylase [Ruminococcus sp. AF24-32LB]RHT59970.1 alpha-amylase [Ruminococcus sp. AM28-41]RHU90324.1 alpha-amylase [Ruminococcus sp. OM08-7]